MRKIILALLLSGLLLVTVGLSIAYIAAQGNTGTPLPSTVAGVVTSEDGSPLSGAIVQIQGTPRTTETSEAGSFSFDGLGGTQPVVLTAWSPDHYIGWVTLDPQEPNWGSGDNVSISLNRLPQRDHSEYEWYSFEDVEGSAACGLCHREYEEWQSDQHSVSAVNHKFINMYTGTDINGEIGQPVQWGREGAALPPDPDQPYTGPGFLPDNPGGQAGNCAACHTPAASKIPNDQNCAWSGCHTSLTVERSNGYIDPPPMPLALRGDAAEGISCEFCHKIGDVILNPETNMPWPDSPGILSLRMYRPADESQQVFFGTLVDVARQDSYLPLLSESAFCSACHFGVFGGVMGDRTVANGTVIYNSYGEWLESPYSDPDSGQTCQDCHMRVSDANWFVFEERGGLQRDYANLHDHTMLGASNEAFMQNAVTMQASAERVDDGVQVQVSITNDQTGHHVPTGVPLRSMMLVVEAVGEDGQVLEMTQGLQNPDFAGDYAGTPGKTYAKILRDEWTGETPTAAFWRPVSIIEDSRIPALETDTTHYTFAAPPDGTVTLNIRLIYRRAFYDLMQQKGWNDPDIIMEHETLQIPAS